MPLDAVSEEVVADGHAGFVHAVVALVRLRAAAEDGQVMSLVRLTRP